VLAEAHNIITKSLHKNKDLMLEIDSDDNRSLGCVDLTSNKSFTLNVGNAGDKIKYTKHQKIAVYNTHGLAI